MGHLNDILARVGGNLNDNFQKSQMPGGLPGGGMLKLRFDRYITSYLLIQTLIIISTLLYFTNEWQKSNNKEENYCLGLNLKIKMVNPFDIYSPVTLESGQLHERIDPCELPTVSKCKALSKIYTIC